MKSTWIDSPRWSTASFGGVNADTSPGELSALGDHMAMCKNLSGSFFSAQCMAQAVHGFVASRMVTSLLVAAVLMGAAALIL